MSPVKSTLAAGSVAALTDLGPWNGLIDSDSAEVSVGRGHANLEYTGKSKMSTFCALKPFSSVQFTQPAHLDTYFRKSAFKVQPKDGISI